MLFFWGSSKRVKNRQKSSFGAEISRTVGDKGPRKCRKSRKFGPYGRDHNFCQNPKNGHFSAFFTPPKKPLKMAKNRLFWGPRQNHHDKHVCEIANSSSHVHHNYFFSLHMCECGNSHSPKWGQKWGVFGGSKNGVSKGSKQASCFDGSCHSRCEIEVMFYVFKTRKNVNWKNKTQLQPHACMGCGPPSHKPTQLHHAQIDLRRPHMTLLACSSHQINL